MSKNIINVICMFVLLMGFAIAQDAPGADPAQPQAQEIDMEKINTLLKQAETELANKEYNNVLRTLAEVSRESRGDEEVKNKVNAITEKLIQAGNALVQEAEAAEKTDLLKAYKLYIDIANNWSLREIRNKGRDGSQRIAAMPEFKAAQESSRNETQAQQLYESATKQLEGLKDAKDRMVKYRKISIVGTLQTILSSYPSTETAKKAQTKIDELLKDEEVKKGYEDQKEMNITTALYSVANICMQYNKKEDAIKFLKMIIETYPDSRHAARAKTELEALQK